MGGFASVAEFVAGRITRSALGKASKGGRRANGQGNLTAAMAHAAEQVALELARRTTFDLATLSAVSSAAFPSARRRRGRRFSGAPPPPRPTFCGAG